MSALEISGNQWSHLNWQSYRNLFYPDFDICDELDPGIGIFDMVIADQVWEHLDRPYRATRNVRELLRDGGYFWLATPFFAKLHGAPQDCSRWTARGLKNLLIECGFDEDKISTNSWGNRNAARKDMRGNARRWGRFDPDVDSLDNDPGFPIMTWGYAQK